MTEYFEVHARDGAARLGELRLRDPVTTPTRADDVVVDGGSLWGTDRNLPDGTEAKLTVLPHRSFPAGTDPTVQDSFAVDYPDVDYPSAGVVTAETAADHGCDAYVLSNAPGVVGHGASFRAELIGVRESIPADTALYLAGVATPRNVATLAAAGVDLVDAKLARVKGRQGRYLTPEGEYHLDELDELPAAHPGDPPLAEFTREDCVAHNVAALDAELRTVRTRIRRGRLRDYLEGQARHGNWLTASVREFDQQYRYLERRTPVIRDTELSAATEDSLNRVEIQRFADRVTTRYRNRFSNPLVLVPCSARKPYGDSQSHAQFHRAIDYRGHVASMTSPIGVVPQELECTYPAQHYDAVVTGNWTDGEKTFVAAVLERYLERNDYPRVIAHVSGEGYRDICERVADRVGVPFEFTATDHPTTPDSLSTLDAALSGELKYPKRERQHNTVRAIADYQFGAGAGDDLFPDLQTTSRHPKLQVRDGAGTQLAAQVPQYGVLAFTLAGARHWAESPAPTKRVDIDGFVPHGSVLAPGVTDADAGVRVGDEVVVEGPAAFGVGRATMHGDEMQESTRGVAVEMRHVEATGDNV
jgi:archaeosine synthase